MAKKTKGPRQPASGDVATNRRARHKFQVLEKMECGIELRGSEVKSLREGKAQLNEAYAIVEKGEVWLREPTSPVPAGIRPEPTPIGPGSCSSTVAKSSG
jgi:hypothetical protein